MKFYLRQSILLLTLLLVLVGCSTKKNTAATRAYHSTTTRFNIMFNAQTNFNKGIEAMQKNQQDDYSTILPLYPISNHENGKMATGSMDIVIEKCRKSIKLHSIQKKPTKNQKKAKDPAYQQWLKQTEFNPMIKKAWLLLGQAEFEKADFIGAVGTFSYVMRQFSAEPAVVTEARIWTARAYAEMGWFYEAEDILGKINENDVTRELNGIFAATKADLLLKQKHHKEAIPFLKIALAKEKNNYQKTRFNYILGQLLLEQNQRKEAANYFRAVLKLTPPYTMEFNAQMQALQAETANPSKAIKSLEKMANNPNNKEYLDQIYYVAGNIYLYGGKEEKAIANYKKAIDKSVRNGIEKAVVLLKLGDLYYEKKRYMDAHPCFEEAATIINTTNENYDRVILLAETLGDLALNYNMVVLQDSLQHLSTLSDKEQRAIVDKLIAQVIAEEEEAKKLAEEEALALNTPNNNGGFGNAGLPPIGGKAEWYFYNPSLIASGKTDFQRRWGKRKLEDHWRRLNKMSQIMDNEEVNTETKDTIETSNEEATINNLKDPEFYLAQIPKNPAQLEKSNTDIATALLNMADIYQNRLEDAEMAEATMLDFQRRFPKHERLLESYYTLYQIYGHMQENDKREQVRLKIIADYPTSKQAIILSQPDYTERMAKMFAMQDSLYEATYVAYSQNKFSQVLDNYNYMVKNYPLSTLLPNFTFLQALSLGKTASAEQFRAALSHLVAQYPASDVTSMAKDILALMGQGQEAQKGSSHGNLIALRDQETKAETDAAEQITNTKTYQTEKQTAFVILLVPNDTTNINQLLYDMAAYNFSKFLIKDFDLALRTVDKKEVVVISNFENYESAMWYQKMIINEPLLSETITKQISRLIPISEDNLKLVNTLTLETYIQFSKQNFK